MAVNKKEVKKVCENDCKYVEKEYNEYPCIKCCRNSYNKNLKDYYKEGLKRF